MGKLKNLNKLLIGALIGGTVVGLGMSPKGKSIMNKAKDFLKGGIDELKKEMKKLDDEDKKKKDTSGSDL